MLNKLFSLSAVTLLASSFTVNAALIEVNYEGTVYRTSGDGAGYSRGDSVSGALFINTDLAPTDRHGSSSVGDYYNNGRGNSDFVSGNTSPGTRSYDQVNIQDDYYSSRDYFFIRDREFTNTRNGRGNYSYLDNYLTLWAFSYSLDFINGDGLEQLFDLNLGDAAMYGNIHSYENIIENGRRTDYHNGSANLRLSHLSVGPAVPEPGMLALMALGIAGLGFKKRRAVHKIEA